MSIVDHFNRVKDAAFVRSYDYRMAQRQYRVSLVLIVVLTIAAFAFGFSFRIEGSMEHQGPAQSAHQFFFANSTAVKWSRRA